MKTIASYPMTDLKQQTIKLPKNAQILSIQSWQRRQAVMTALIDTDEKETVDTIIMIYGVGEEIKEAQALSFICSIVDGPFVWNYFRRVLP